MYWEQGDYANFDDRKLMIIGELRGKNKSPPKDHTPGHTPEFRRRCLVKDSQVDVTATSSHCLPPRMFPLLPRVRTLPVSPLDHSFFATLANPTSSTRNIILEPKIVKYNK